MTIYACSKNSGKLREFAFAASTFDALEVVIEPLPGLDKIPAPEECGDSFDANARLKAAYYSKFTDHIVFADDSGLEVDALHGAPGIFSARYAGSNAGDAANNRLLLENMERNENRRARFICVIAAARREQILTAVCGDVEGDILYTPRGLNGFGYDPLFLYKPLGKSFAEITQDAKFRISHRGKAFAKLLAWLLNPPTAKLVDE